MLHCNNTMYKGFSRVFKAKQISLFATKFTNLGRFNCMKIVR